MLLPKSKPRNFFSRMRAFRRWLQLNKLENTFSFTASYFSKQMQYFDQLGAFFHFFIPSPPIQRSQPDEHSILGIHTRTSLLLDPHELYTDPIDAVRQGDFFRADNLNIKEYPQADYWIVLTHTCEVSRRRGFIQLLPGYDDEKFNDTNFLALIGIKKPNPPSAIRNNNSIRFIGFPPHHQFVVTEGHVIVDLGVVHSLHNDSLAAKNPILSLTFAGNAYFCNRAATYFFRDVMRWDDERIARKSD